jgi:hypothetical protein
MMCQNYESVVMPYRLPSEWAGIPSGIGLGSLYNPYLVTPPRLYAESIGGSGITGIWVDGDSVVVASWTDMIYWPGWAILRWAFNVNTGDFLERGAFVGGYYAEDVNQGAGGELYLSYVTGPIYPLSPAPEYALLVDEAILPAHFGYIVLAAPFFDRMRNRAVIGGQSGVSSLRVFEFVSGTWIRDIVMPHGVVCIVHDEGTRVFVLLSNKAVLSINYETGQRYSYVRIPQITNVSNARIAWHKAYRRLLLIEHTADNVDGSSTVTIRGYRYIDIPVHVCKPIPLTRLRDGVRSAVLVKQVGDLGEGIAGLAALTSDAVSATVTRASVALDGDGEGRGELLGTAEGAETVTATVEAACLL